MTPAHVRNNEPAPLHCGECWRRLAPAWIQPDPRARIRCPECAGLEPSATDPDTGTTYGELA